MDILNEINNSKNRNIVIQIDDKQSWLDHVKFFRNLEKDDLFFDKIVNEKPKSMKGCRCYLSYKDKICGWLEIYSVKKKGSKFIIKMHPHISLEESNLKISAFSEQYRYFYDNSNEQ